MSKRVLGLDLGPNSVGWALVTEGDASGPEAGLIDLGVRIFPEGVDNFDTAKEVSRNEQRRVARGMRRQIKRHARRRRRLTQALVQSGLWPSDPAAREALMAMDPYALRSRAIRERLEPHEIGRVLLHLNQRRGFLSNRKKDRGDKEVKGMLAEINENERLRCEAGFETIGAWLADKQANLHHHGREENDHVRNRHLARSQYEQEFEAIWNKQAEYHPDLLTDELKHGRLGSMKYPVKPIRLPRGMTQLEAFGLHGILFFQRRMYWPKSVVGLCELEPKQKRCPRADRHAERFRVLQEVNNLRFVDPDTHIEQGLSDGQRAMVIEYLGTREKATFDQIRKKLGFLESVRFNLERGQRSSLKGMTVDWLMATAIGKQWHDRPEDEKDEIVRLLIDNDGDKDAVHDALTDQYGFTADEAEKALDVDLPTGYTSLSLVAIDRLLPHLQRGLVYQSASDPERSALHAAGYLRRDELGRRLFGELPDLRRINPANCRLGDIPNPVVKRALTELRKVVNAIIREYGKPDAVHLEMARSVKMGPKARSEYNSRIRERERERSNAADSLRQAGTPVRRESILRYQLWEEQSHECMYCGQPISQQQLFGEGAEVDVDHILPRSRSLDDSQLNKVVCHRRCNHDKGQQTPYEWLAASDNQYEAICQRAAALHKKGLMPYRKYVRFLQKELKLDEFVNRQLTDTAYITRATMEYLRLLFHQDHAVLGLKGQLTAELRYHWGLDTILAELPDSPAWQEHINLRPGEKNRADHRHHTIDALVVALTNRSRLHELSDIVHRGGARRHGEILDEPWPDFREDVQDAVSRVNVSHRVERKVRGALHEGRIYGPTDNPGEWVFRTPVTKLSPSEIDRIRDDVIRRLVIDRLAEHGIEHGRGKNANSKKLKEALSGLTMPSGVPIKKVRILKPDKTIQKLRIDEGDKASVKPGSTHHLCIFEWQENGKAKREAVFVTMLEAVNRLKRGEPVIQRTHPKRPEARFVMSLGRGELILADWKGEEKLLTLKTSISTEGKVEFAEHVDARKSSGDRKYHKYKMTINSMFARYNARKVTVDPLGRVRRAKD
jgi:CRISPR-associated endonuclease Csn1